METNLETEVLNVLTEILKEKSVAIPDKIQDKRLIEDLELDSLYIIDFYVGISEKTGMKIPDSERDKISTVGECIDYVKKNYKNPKTY